MKETKDVKGKSLESYYQDYRKKVREVFLKLEELDGMRNEFKEEFMVVQDKIEEKEIEATKEADIDEHPQELYDKFLEFITELDQDINELFSKDQGNKIINEIFKDMMGRTPMDKETEQIYEEIINEYGAPITEEKAMKKVREFVIDRLKNE